MDFDNSTAIATDVHYGPGVDGWIIMHYGPALSCSLCNRCRCDEVCSTCGKKK